MKCYLDILVYPMRKHILSVVKGSGWELNATNSGWISPKKTEAAHGGSKKPKRKVAKYIIINKVLLDKINSIVPENKRSALIDKILSEHFGISYEKAYPEAYAKSYGEERYWDIEGEYRKLDIEFPGRNMVSKKRRKEQINFYKTQMLKQK